MKKMWKSVKKGLRIKSFVEGDACVDSQGRPCDLRDAEGLREVRTVMEGFGLGDAWAIELNGRTIVYVATEDDTALIDVARGRRHGQIARARPSQYGSRSLRL